MGEWGTVFLEPARAIIYNIGDFLGKFLLVLLILLIGWLIAKVIKSVVIKTFKSLKLDQLSEKIALHDLLTKGGIKHTLSELIGMICYWLVVLVAFVIAINSINLLIAAELLNRIILYIPNIIAAIFILVLGMFFATLLKNTVNTAATNAGLTQAGFLSNMVEIVVIVFTLMIALEQLNIGARIIELMISIILASIGLGCALAFGLGCRDQAGRFVAELVEKIKAKK
ncbi:MAG: hypothetical protein WC335_01105 [Candidatus Omnitrophota bacterium]|jgi:hypothetical protein